MRKKNFLMTVVLLAAIAVTALVVYACVDIDEVMPHYNKAQQKAQQ